MYTLWLWEDPVFITYMIFVLSTMVPRPILGGLYLYLYAHKLILNYPPTYFSVSALITEYMEEPADFEQCLVDFRTSLEQGTKEFEIIVAHDGVKPASTEVTPNMKLSEKHANRVLKLNARNKRVGLYELVDRAQGEIILLIDSDTFPEPQTVQRLCNVFANPEIGGATTAQRIRNPETFIQKQSDWMEDARIKSSMGALSLFGQVICLPGRCIAIRKSILTPEVMDALVKEMFLGQYCISGDDRFLTNIILKQGMKCVMVPDAPVTTLAPRGTARTGNVWLRWARSSIRNTITTTPWLWRKPFAFAIGWSDLIMSPWTAFIVLYWWPYSIITGDADSVMWQAVTLSFVSMMLGLGIRQTGHFLDHPENIKRLPIFAAVATWLQLIRTRGLFTIHKVNVWASRLGADDRSGSTGLHYDSGPTSMTSGNHLLTSNNHSVTM